MREGGGGGGGWGGARARRPPTPRPSLPFSSAARARQHLPFLSRAPVAGVVEHVASGHRLKVRVPSQGVVVALSPAGVRAPTKARAAAGGAGGATAPPPAPTDALADAATDFVRRHALQRDVEITVTGIDRGGTFLGKLRVPATNFDLGPALLKAGLAKLSGRGGEEDPALEAAQAEAKAARKGMWAGWSPEAEAAEAAAAAGPDDSSASPAASIRDVVVTDAAGDGDLSVQAGGDARVPWLTDALAAAGFDRLPPSTAAPPAGALVAAKYAGDGSFYRARVAGKGAAGRLDVHFVDWGNAATVPADDIRSLPPALADLAAVPPQSSRARLAGVRGAGDADARAAAAAAVAAALGGGETLRVQVVGTAAAAGGGAPAGGGAWGGRGSRGAATARVPALLLASPAAPAPPAGAPPDPATSVQADLLRAGVVRLDARSLARAPDGVADALAAAEAEARSARAGVWEYGDPGSDGDE